MRDESKRNPGTEEDNWKRFLLTRRHFIAASAGAAVVAGLPLGCGGRKESEEAAAAADPAAAGTPWAEMSRVLDMVDTVHLAETRHRGEFVDFGTAARYKYTLGGWMTGWDNDMTLNGVSFTWATRSPSRFYFSLDEVAPLTFEFRAKAGGTSSFSVYLNDKPLSRVGLKGDDWDVYRVSAKADQTQAGDNRLQLIYSTASSKVGDTAASVAIDYIRIIPDGEGGAGQFDPPYLATLKQNYTADDRERQSLMLSPGTTLSYYLDVPPDTRLSAAVAAALGNREKGGETSLGITALPADGGPAVELHSQAYGAESWSEELIDLAPVAGKLVRLDISTGGGDSPRLAVGDLALRRDPPKIEPVTRKAKNAILLCIDTLRADKLTAYAKTRVKTPAFDKFAAESTVFDRCQANSGWTKPSCGTLLTGTHPDTHKARGHASRLPDSIPMASELFQAAGFKTGAFIANGYLATEFGFNRAWTKYINHIRERKNTNADNVFKDALEFIEQHKDGPFFTYIQTIDPHVPYDPPEEDLKLYDAGAYEGPVRPRSTGQLLEDFKRKRVELNQRDRRRLEALYDGEVTYHDRHFGHFLDGLRKLRVLDDTIIIVTSDHGEEFFEHGSVGHGHSLYQELLGVPLAIRAPGLFPAGLRTGREVGLEDLLPTALAATGQKLPEHIEGYDLVALTNGEPPDPNGAAFSSFWSEADNRNLQWSVRRGDWKLLMRGPVHSYVYDLDKDPTEQNDVKRDHPIAWRALRIAQGQFVGAPNKRDWTAGAIALEAAATGPAVGQEDTAIPEDLKAQLRELGYMH